MRLVNVAIRNVRRNRRRSIITGVAILFGVMAVMVMRGVTGGMMKMMTDDVILGRTGAMQVHLKGFMDNIDSVPTGMNIPYDDAFMKKILGVPGITGVTGRIQFGGLVSNGVTSTMFVGKATDLLHEKDACPQAATTVQEGSPLEKGDGPHALLGYELAQSFHLKPGDHVSVQTQSPNGRVNALEMNVKGLSASSFPFENKRVLTMPLSTAQSLLGLEGRVTEYAVAIDDVKKLDERANALRAALGPEYEVHTWSELQPFVRDVIRRQQIVLGAVSVVLFIIVITGIINTMLMSVFERVREIGTMLALGVKRRAVMQMFIIEGAVIGIFGGSAGALVGTVLVTLLGRKGLVPPLSGFSPHAVVRPFVESTFVGLAVGVALLGAVIASSWPAWRASRLDPVEALRTP